MSPRESSPSHPDRPSRRRWMALTAAGALGLMGSPGASLGHAIRRGTASGAPGQGSDEIARLMRLASVPGLAWAEVTAGTVRTGGVGVRVAGGSEAVDADTVFEAASLSKPVFAMLVMQLAAEGVLDLERPLRTYLPLPNAADARA
ncbi:MAG TPA: serine hydrolase domain-containing protein, partial [Gemmatimonadales bacterium]|nr:serine hydrolase domain-containing protein [Gemmatimonadales bacterium]